MSILKQLERAAKTCWCPSAKYPNLLASGTIAGTIDDSFVTKSQLEIYDLDLASPTADMKLVGSIESKDCFHSVAWGAKGIEEGGAMSYGLLAGGMSDGSVNIWNVAGILNRSPDALLSRSEVHKGTVMGLEFHPQQPNVLASGASDGEVYVWDLANVKDPKPSKPNPSLKVSHLPPITTLAWNKTAPQILASASEMGETTVWDLRQKRSIITIRNSARMNVRASGLAWNPSAGVQLAVCYNNYPVAEVWDLRQSMQPKVKLECFHAGSILALDWCPHDPALLLTTGEDGRMAGWNPLSGQLLYDYPATGHVAFDLQWSPKQPNLISTCSYDGKVQIQSIDTAGPSHVPAWMSHPVGASFGFGGKLVTFGTDRPGASPTTGAAPASPHRPTPPKVTLQQLVTDPEVLDKAAELQKILKESDFAAFCAYKVSHAADDDEKTIWTFMKILFEEEGNQRYLLLKELGFEPPPSSDIVMPQPSVPVVPDISEQDFFDQFQTQETQANGEETANGDALTDNAALKSALDGVDESKDGKEPEASPASSAGGSSTAASTKSSNKPWVEDADDRAIRQALVFGDFKTAVARCLASNRMADAIVFASFGPPQLWEETRAAYFNQHPMPFIRHTMKNVSNQTLDELIQESHLNNWRETLAVCITYTATDKYRELVNQLGDRLEQAGQNIPAVVCYICASNMDKAIEMWTSKIPTHISGGDGDGSALLGLHDAIEKIAVFAQATNAHANKSSNVLSIKYAEYAQMLASQGDLRGAYNYLSRVAVPNDPASSVLLDRIFHADSESFLREQYPMPPFPFPIERVDVDPTLAQTLHQMAQIKAQRQANMAQQNAAAQAQMAQARAAQQQQYQPQQPRQTQPAYPQNGTMPQQGQGYGASPYGAPQMQQQQYGQQSATAQYQQQAATAYGAAPPMPQPQPRAPYQPQQYGQPQPPQQPSYGQSSYGQAQPPSQPQANQYGSQPQQNYGSYQQTPAPSLPPRPAQAPYQPQAAPMPQPQPPQPQPTYQPPQPQSQPSATPYQPPSYTQAQSTAPAAAAQSSPALFTPQTAAAPSMPPTSQQPPQPTSNTYGSQPKPFTPATAHPSPAPAPAPSTAAPTPAAAAPSAASAPAANLTAQLGPADQALIAPLDQCLNRLMSVGLKTPEQKKVNEIRSKLGELARRLSGQELSPTAMAELHLLVQSVANNDFTSAQRHHLNLVKTDWANNNEWLLGLKTMLLMAKKYLEKSG